MSKSEIEWCDRTWNPVMGCTPISAGCANCYAKRMAERFAGPWGLDPENPFAVGMHPERLKEPLRWKKPSMVFVCSMSDLFHEDVPDDFIIQIFEVMANAQLFFGHNFLVLTKRPERMKSIIERIQAYIEEQKKPISNEDGTTTRKMVFAFPLQNIWLGVTAENQEQADKRIPLLLQTPAAKRFVSVEPMLGPVDMNNITVPAEYDRLNPSGFYPSKFNALTTHYDDEHFHQPPAKLDWVICGGESGPGSRPMHPEWARSLRDQCECAGVRFMFKQWGEWVPFYDRDKDDPDWNNVPKESNQICRINLAGGHGFSGDRVVYFQKVGKKAAGRLLDGVLHNGRPVIS